MTLANNDRYTGGLGTGVLTLFSFDFPVDTEAEINVYVDNTIVDSADYTVDTGAQTVTFDTAPADGAIIAIIGTSVPTQTVAYSRTDNSANLEALAAQLDLHTKLIQELKRDVLRAVLVGFETSGVLLDDLTVTAPLYYNATSGRIVGGTTLAGAGDMLASVYDPNAVNDDAFDMDNMVESTDAKVLTAAEREKLSYLTITAAFDVDAFLASANASYDTLSEIGATLSTVVGWGNHASAGYEPGNANILKANVTDSLEVGFTAAGEYHGSISSGTFTFDPADNNIQYLENEGAFTFALTSGKYTGVLYLENGASPGAVTFSGITIVTGDSLTLTTGHYFELYISAWDSLKHIHVVAMQ
jgi:hypothetical protein